MTKFNIRPEAAPLFIRLLHALDHGVPCVVDPEPFTSDDRAERVEAAESCQWCPALEECRTYADAQGEKWHVWAGVDHTPTSTNRPKEKKAA